MSYKIIRNFSLDLSNLPAASTRRRFNIYGDPNAKFSLEIKNEDSNYYNFVTNTIQEEKAKLEGTINSSGNYQGSISFPLVGDDDHYDIYLWAGEGTRHDDYAEVRFGDGSLDINSSKGSSSSLLQKIIYQYTDLTLTLIPYSLNNVTDLIKSSTKVDATVTAPFEGSVSKASFKMSCEVNVNTKSYQIIQQPTANDFLAFIQPVIGSAPVNLPGENIYPSASNTDTVNGAVTSGTTVTMDTAVASKMKVGDRVTGNTALNAVTATVVSLDSTYAFTLSQAIAIANDITLTFSNRMNYSWPISNYANKIRGGMVVFGTDVVANTLTGTYKDSITILEGTEEEETIIKSKIEPIDLVAKKPTIVKGLTTVQEGNITFDKQQPLVLAGDTLKIGGYGEEHIFNISGWDVKLTNMAIALTAITTTTTSSTVDSTSTTVGVTSVNGILPSNVSSVSGIGINPSVADPTVSTRSATSGAGNVVLSATQALESGITLTFSGAGQVATVTGDIEILKAGTSSANLRLNMENLLSIT